MDTPRESVIKYRNSANSTNSSWTFNKFFVTGIIVGPFCLLLLWLIFSIYAIFWPSYGFIPLCYISWLFYDRHTYSRGGRRSNWYKNLSIWKHYADYFDIKLVKTAELDPTKNYLLCAHPHGIIPIGIVGALSMEARGASKVFPGMRFTPLTDAIFNYMPFYREHFMLVGSCSASKESMEYILSQEGGGQAPILFPGGAAEAIESHPNTNVLYLKKRKGFIKLALRHGVPLVPVFTFGETDVLLQVPNPKGSVFRSIQNLFLRIRRIPLLFLKNPVPQEVPNTTVVGAPIHVEKKLEPTQEDIDSLHALYIKSLSDLYYKYRDSYAPNPKVDLVFV